MEALQTKYQTTVIWLSEWSGKRSIITTQHHHHDLTEMDITGKRLHMEIKREKYLKSNWTTALLEVFHEESTTQRSLGERETALSRQQ